MRIRWVTGQKGLGARVSEFRCDRKPLEGSKQVSDGI